MIISIHGSQQKEGVDALKCPICEAIIADVSVRKICDGCGNGDRTRTVY